MFRILSLTILHHKVLGEVSLDFSKYDDIADANSIYTTVVIGENGIGKSFLLSSLVDIFQYLDEIKAGTDERKDTPSFRFHIKYVLGGDEYEFANFGVINHIDYRHQMFLNLHYRKNGKNVRASQIISPTKIIASTMTVNDKFVAKSKGRYSYKGIRNEKSPSTTGTRTMIRKTVTSLMYSLDMKEGFRDELMQLLMHLGLSPQITLHYNVRYKDVFLSHMTPEKLRDIYDNQEKYFHRRQTELWGTSNFQKIRNDEDKLEKICRFLSKNTTNGVYSDGINFELMDEGWRIMEDREAIELLSSLDILSFPSLKIYKTDQQFTFEESSSGETHLLCQLIGIMSDIEHDSLILIDEPENSSHPNWQINYIGWIKSIFHAYSDCHFIIATHSHFVLTDLKPGDSDIIALERNQVGLHDIAKNLNTYCWSVDDILYRVFHVRNTRNEVFERQMFKLYRLLEHKEQYKREIRELYTELSRYVLNADDPLNNLLKLAHDA